MPKVEPNTDELDAGSFGLVLEDIVEHVLDKTAHAITIPVSLPRERLLLRVRRSPARHQHG